METIFPAEFERRMKEQLSSEWNSFEAIHHAASPVSIRLNPRKPGPTNSTEDVPWSAKGKYLPSRPVFTLDPSFHSGAYYVQEASSMFLEQAVAQLIGKKDIVALDLCAAPGGKTTNLLGVLSENSLLISNEVIRSRVAVLTENVIKWGYPNTVVTNNDSEDFSKLNGLFDLIVVDAPCSGEGLFRKDRDAIKEWSPENVALCASRQKRILHEIWPALKQDGILIYSTCTYEPSENESNLLDFSKEYSLEFLPINIHTAWNVEKIDLNNVIGYRFMPHRLKGDGFFLAAMQKKSEQHHINTRMRKEVFETATKKASDEVLSWYKSDGLSTIQRNETIQVVPSHYRELIGFLSAHLKITYAGTFTAVQKQNKLVPEHAAALSVFLNHERFPTLDLDKEHALQYLRKDNLTIDVPASKGFALVRYNGLALGWVNVIPGRMNNLYPSEWRIRMKPGDLQ